MNIYQIKFFVLCDDDVVDGFMRYDDAKKFCDDMNSRYMRYNHKFTIFNVDSADDDKELERIRENYLYQLQEQEEEWDR